MPFPKTETELSEAGYKFKSHGHCRSCGSEISWYETPKGKMIPLDPDLASHWSTCPDADSFRDPKPRTGPFGAKTDGYKGNR